MTHKPRLPTFVLITTLAACGAAYQGARPLPDAFGGAGGGPGGTGGGSGGATTLPPIVRGEHGLPVPPGGAVAKPAGTPGNLVALDWAGFRSAVSWSFDDGQPSQIAHYAELQATGVPMTFYITTANSGLAGFDATWTQAVRDGHEIGNHTVHHCHFGGTSLSGCTSGASAATATVDDEIDACTAYITSREGQAGVWTFAAPFGDSAYGKPAAARFLVNRGVGATNGSGTIGPGDNTDPFNLPCTMANENDTATIFDRQTDAARTAGKWLIFLVHTIKPTSDNWYAPVDIAEVTAGMTHGRALGDVWMGTVIDVAAYWIGQRLLKTAVATVAGSATTWTWTLPVGFPPGKYLRVKVDGGTLAQAGTPLAWDEHGYYEVALDAGTLTLAP
jgi:peptidoglycan/xylan/chitin deacetylase (PgdA/CDA1 family)